MLDGDATHAVAGLPGADGTETLVVALGRLRSSGATSFGAALPAEGDPVGLGGPRAFNDAALEAGEAVVVAGAGLGLVPVRVGAAITWVAHPAQRRQLPDVGEADRGLRAALLETAEALADLDVARWRPEVADRLLNLRHRDRVAAPDGVPPRCVELAARGLQAARDRRPRARGRRWRGDGVRDGEPAGRAGPARPGGSPRPGGRLLARGLAAVLSRSRGTAIASVAR